MKMVAKPKAKKVKNGVPYPQWAWWVPGECVVELLERGHFPTTLMVKLPDNKIIEIDEDTLEQEIKVKWTSPI
jgi:hypothetical protein